jgi:hypothetical protein
LAFSLGLAFLSSSAQAQESRAHYDSPVVVLEQDSPAFQRLFDFDDDGFMDAFGSRKRSRMATSSKCAFGGTMATAK